MSLQRDFAVAVVIDTLSNLRPRHPEKAHRADAPIQPKPDWIRVRAPVSKGYAETHGIVRSNKLVTVCEEAGCPNIGCLLYTSPSPRD